jgi:hypothetical protein
MVKIYGLQYIHFASKDGASNFLRLIFPFKIYNLISTSNFICQVLYIFTLYVYFDSKVLYIKLKNSCKI